MPERICSNWGTRWASYFIEQGCLEALQQAEYRQDSMDMRVICLSRLHWKKNTEHKNAFWAAQFNL